MLQRKMEGQTEVPLGLFNVYVDNGVCMRGVGSVVLHGNVGMFYPSWGAVIFCPWESVSP